MTAECPLAPAGPPRHTRGMRQATHASVLRWSFIGSCLAAYCTAVGWLIADARANTGAVFAWLGAGLATLPWTAVVFVFEPAQEDERAWRPQA